MPRISNYQDVGAAVIFLTFGLAGLMFGGSLELGTASEMGPGYFPFIVSVLLIGVGIATLGRSFFAAAASIQPIQVRPLLLLLIPILVFAPSVGSLGLAITTFLFAFTVSFARKQARIVPSVILALIASAFIVALFVFALGQPIPIWWTI